MSSKVRCPRCGSKNVECYGTKLIEFGKWKATRRFIWISILAVLITIPLFILPANAEKYKTATCFEVGGSDVTCTQDGVTVVFLNSNGFVVNEQGYLIKYNYFPSNSLTIRVTVDNPDHYYKFEIRDKYTNELVYYTKFTDFAVKDVTVPMSNLYRGQFNVILKDITGGETKFTLTKPNFKIFYYYKPTCPACENVKPYIEDATKKLNIVFCNVKEMNTECLEVSKSIELYAIPTIAVKQDGDYEIYVGSNEIMGFLLNYDKYTPNSLELITVITKLDVKLEFSQFPKKYTCDGEDVSPKIEIYGLRSDVKSLAIIVDDPDAPLGTFNHWIIWNIEPTNIIPEGIPNESELTNPIKAVQGKNDFGRVGYNGPCPPLGEIHRYFFKVYALDTFLDLKAGSTKKELERAIEGHILQYGEIVATYVRLAPISTPTSITTPPPTPTITPAYTPYPTPTTPTLVPTELQTPTTQPTLPKKRLENLKVSIEPKKAEVKPGETTNFNITLNWSPPEWRGEMKISVVISTAGLEKRYEIPSVTPSSNPPINVNIPFELPSNIPPLTYNVTLEVKAESMVAKDMAELKVLPGTPGFTAMVCIIGVISALALYNKLRDN